MEEEHARQWPKETRTRKQTTIYKHTHKTKVNFVNCISFVCSTCFTYMEDGTILL